MIPLSVPEIRRLLLTLREPPTQFRFRLEWSQWRRHHQATARRGHVARRVRRHATALGLSALARPEPQPSSAVALRALVSADLSEAEWARILPLLPPEKSRRGRPAHAHRPLVAAMIWVERTGAAWRQVPPHVGPWQRVYNRYRIWRRSGLWTRIVAAVAQQSTISTDSLREHAPPDSGTTAA